MSEQFQVYGVTVTLNPKTLTNALRYTKYEKYDVVDINYGNGLYQIQLKYRNKKVSISKTPHKLRDLLYYSAIYCKTF